MSNIHEKIRELRKQKGINQKQVAESAGLSVAAYSNIESGISKSITIEAGKGIAKALDENFVQLFEISSPGTEIAKFEIENKVLQEKIKELEKWIEIKDKLINLLQDENESIKYENAVYKILNNFDELIADEKLIRAIPEPERTPDIELRIEMLKELFDNYIVEGFPSKKVLLNILFSNMDFISLMEDESENKEEFMKKSTSYLNQFIDVDANEVEKYMKVNLKTKWDNNFSRPWNQTKWDFRKYWKDID